MSAYISRSACRGRRPSTFESHDGRSRAHLVGVLLKDRSVARFIVAPDGYGKTSVAFEYAETMFSWKHVFWLNAQSPCFIRDVDDGAVADLCFSADREAALVVIDDLPELDAKRAEDLSCEMDKLLANKCEVLVTCTPMADVLGARQLDRILISSRELLLEDDEVDMGRTSDERLRVPASSLRAPQRVAALAWKTDDSAEGAFARATLDEEMPSEALLLMASAYAMRSGLIHDLLDMVDLSLERVHELLECYPHVDIDEERGIFEAPSLSTSCLVTPLRKHMSMLVQRSRYSTPEELVFAWAKRMMRAGREERACEMVGALLPLQKRLSWLFENAYELVRRACILPLLHIARDRKACKGDAKKRLSAVQALCYRLLGDSKGALSYATRIAFDTSAPDDARTCCLLIVTSLGDAIASKRAVEALEQQVRTDVLRSVQHGSFWSMLAEARCVSSNGLEAFSEWWQRAEADGADDDVLAITASWLFSLVTVGEDDAVGCVVEQMTPAERYIRKRLVAVSTVGRDFFVASAGLSMEEAHGRGAMYEGGPLETATLIFLRNVELDMMAQAHRFEGEQTLLARRESDWAATHPDALLNQKAPVSVMPPARCVPLLTIRMFGRFEVLIGDEPISKQKFRRGTTRSLLVLLAAARGREIPRDVLSKTMWPKGTEENARKNFYTAWSDLKHALMLPDGTCPYLLRHQFGCSLETRYVHSDIDKLDDVCRELLFGVPNVERWSQLYAIIDRDFSSDLMPSETKNALVVQARIEYRNKLVDALVAATESIARTDTPQWGVWFARAALNHDDTREDAYLALMHAQIASNQRTAAMMTYLKCRRVMSDKLGIDPSPSTTGLYEDLLDSGDPE